MHVAAGLVLHVFVCALWRGVQAVSPVPSVPPRISALSGFCVVIPCSFPPSPTVSPLSRRRERVDVRIRFRGGGPLFPLRSTAFNSQDRDQESRDYQGRASLVGPVSEGDCSVRFSRVDRGDSRMYEVALKSERDLLWGKASTFNLQVTDQPSAPVITGTWAFTEGQMVTLNCSTEFSCQSKPPSLTWSWVRGAPANSSESWTQLTLPPLPPLPPHPGLTSPLSPPPHRPVLTSTLSFIASHHVQPRVRCEARYPGGKRPAVHQDLHVTFSPTDVQVHVQTLMVHEGGSALVSCSCKADPPVSEYRWSYVQHGRHVHLHQRGHSVRLLNVTRDMRVLCSARNLIGRGDSPPLTLNVQFGATVVQRASFCAWDGLTLLCQCAAQSNPGASITWSVNGSVPPPDFNVSFTVHSDTSKATVRGRLDAAVPVVCHAINALGNDSALLLLGGEASPLLWLVLPAVTVCCLLLLLCVGLCCFRNRTKKGSLRPATRPENLSIYQERTPLYINCTDVTHIYTNGSYQLVYQNSTPCFVQTKQSRPMGRRGGERRRRAERRNRGNQSCSGPRDRAQSPAATDTDTAIYLEIL